MLSSQSLYISTVCLERNRWGSRVPSYAVSEWLPRFTADGFEGVELWENHYVAADEAERDRLDKAAPPLSVYNSYVKFDDASAPLREQAAAIITRLGAKAVKYNLGGDRAELATYRRNLMAWSEQLPATCRLLCECHPGTVLERLEDAVAFFDELDLARFGVIAHVSGAAEQVEPWLVAFAGRVQHVHLQMRGADTDPAVPANRDPYDACFDVLTKHGFTGSVAVEFTRGIGREENIETLYANACTDLAYCRERLSRETIC